METLLGMIDSSVKSLGEVEFIISRSVSITKFFVMNRFSNPHFRFFTQYISHSITKKFPIEILLKMIDSTCPRLFMLESVLPVIVLIGNFWYELISIL
jgi:hypothetical protein